LIKAFCFFALLCRTVDSPHKRIAPQLVGLPAL